MKFSWKVFLCTTVMIALSFALAGAFLVSSVFDNALERETKLALEESQMLRFSFETAVNLSLTYGDPATDKIIGEIAQALESNNLYENRRIRISDESFAALYQSPSAEFDASLLKEVTDTLRGHRIIEKDGRYYMQTACRLDAAARKLYLESFRDITSIFEERSQHYAMYRVLTLCILFLGSLIMYMLSLWLTHPIKSLALATRRIARGQYEKRVHIKSKDEIGALADDFNAMADALEVKISDLQDAARRQEDFVASFAHELKTPLTAIIGYADILRSKELGPDEQFRAANYIFSEGKRLESLSRKLMDMIVLRRQNFQRRTVSARVLCGDVVAVAALPVQQDGLTLLTRVEDAPLCVEPDLMKTLLINLIDNARKASPAGERIYFTGRKEEDGYAFFVRDFGKGIPKESLPKITEAFYMVDKSRSRKNGGSGLGLAICSEIARLHGTKLDFKSEPGKGTTVRIVLGGSTDAS